MKFDNTNAGDLLKAVTGCLRREGREERGRKGREKERERGEG